MERFATLIALPSELAGSAWPQLLAALLLVGMLFAAWFLLRDDPCRRHGATQDAIRRSRRALADRNGGDSNCRAPADAGRGTPASRRGLCVACASEE